MLGTAKLDNEWQNFTKHIPETAITFSKPASVWDGSDSADMFYSFHSIYLRVEFSGKAKCEGENNVWEGDVFLRFRDSYSFTDANKHAIPGSEQADKDFYYWQKYGPAKAFKISGVQEKRSQRYVVSNDGEFSSPAGGGNGGVGGY